MKNFSFKNLKIGIFGVGKSNLAVLNFLNKQGVTFSLTVRSDAQIDDFTQFHTKHIYSKSHAFDNINEDILFLSPSVRRDNPKLKEASIRGTLLSSDTELFFEKNNLPVYAVTGSDGKSSTSYLISSMLNFEKKSAVAAGNFGIPLCSILGEGKIAATELSSFQLMNIAPNSRRAVITNITPNHLDWHKDMDEYISAKLNIAKNTEGLIIDYDSDILRKSVSDHNIFAAVSQIYSFNELKKLINAENYITTDKISVFLNGSEYFSLKNAIRKEKYNIKNFMLAASATIGDVKKESIENAINSFSGLSHRKEIVAHSNGITYIDSSIDSTPERTLNTLRSLSGNVAVIIGGRGKGISLKELAEELPKITVGACLMGEVGETLSELLSENKKYKTVHAENMKDAVKLASSLLYGGGTVILSPAATSFDKYKNFEQRGEDFKRNCP